MQLRNLPLFGVLICLVGATAGASVVPLLARDALVGKWKAEITNDDASKTSNDNISFKGGKFTSENETADGFESAAYDDDPSPQGISAKWSVTLTNKDGDTAKWEGFSTGNEMTGTLVITKKDGTKTNYTFKASKG